jgi:hypothetical protein
MTKHPKRPRDLNQWAKHMVDLVTVDEDERRAIQERLALVGRAGFDSEQIDHT